MQRSGNFEVVFTGSFVVKLLAILLLVTCNISRARSILTCVTALARYWQDLRMRARYVITHGTVVLTQYGDWVGGLFLSDHTGQELASLQPVQILSLCFTWVTIIGTGITDYNHTMLTGHGGHKWMWAQRNTLMNAGKPAHR